MLGPHREIKRHPDALVVIVGVINYSLPSKIGMVLLVYF